MVTGHPGFEEISSEPRPMPSRLRALTMAAVVGAAVVAGLLVGARTDVPERLGLTSDAGRTPVAVGAVEHVPSARLEPQFGLPVLNLTDARIEVSLAGVGG